MDNKTRLLNSIESFLEKQNLSPDDYVDTASDDTYAAAQAPKDKGSAAPAGKVPTKIFELVRRGGRVFERVRTAWVNPNVAQRLEQRKVATDWVRTLGNYLPLYFVGGYVRDKFLKKVSKDIDIIALVPLSEVRPILEKLNIRFSEHTNAHSRIKFEVGGISVDVISVKSDDLPENLRSRDFTINSVAQSVTGQFYDPTRGLDDLKKKLLRTPGNDPITTFENDPVRILRGVRFLSDMGLKAHPSIPDAAKKTAAGLAKKKPRRLGFELKKILEVEKPWLAAKIMADWEIFPHISEDLNNIVTLKQRGEDNKYHVFPQVLAMLRKAKSQDLAVNAAILFSQIGKYDGEKIANLDGWEERSSELARKNLENLGFSKKITNRISLLIYNLKILSIDSPSPDDYRKVSLSAREDLEKFYTVAEAFIASTRKDIGVISSLKDNIAKYKGGESDGEEQRTTVAVEKYFNDSDKITKAQTLDEIDDAIELLLSIDPRMQEIEQIEKMVHNG